MQINRILCLRVFIELVCLLFGVHECYNPGFSFSLENISEYKTWTIQELLCRDYYTFNNRKAKDITTDT